MHCAKKVSVGLVMQLFVCVSIALAQAPAGYYSEAKGKSGAQLKSALHEIINEHTQRSYGELWTDFVATDSRTDGKVWDMYSNCTFTWGTGAGGNQDQGSGGGSECQFYNREHSFPKSWFDDGYPMYTDLFHLIPTDKYVNNQRGNMPYGVVGTVSKPFNNGSKIGDCAYAGCTGKVFEPINEYKGDFARTYFYMATRYEDLIASWQANTAETQRVLDGTSYPAFQAWLVNMLLDWHRSDTVSAKERSRNDAVYGIQNNRNPFIDHPELAEYVWGDSVGKPWGGGAVTSVAQVKQQVKFELYPNPANAWVNIRLSDNVQLQKAVEVIKGLE